MASEDVKTSESMVSKFVNLAKEAELAKEEIKPTKYRVYNVFKSLVVGGVAGGVSRTAVALSYFFFMDTALSTEN